VGDIENIVIKFQVSKYWLVNNGFMSEQGVWLGEPSDIGVDLQMYSNGAWDYLPTSEISRDNNTLYFQTTTQEFGNAFAVTAKKLGTPEQDCSLVGCPQGFECNLIEGVYWCEEIIVPTCDVICPEGELLNTTSCTCYEPGKEPAAGGIDFMLVVIGIGVVLIVLFVFRERLIPASGISIRLRMKC
jgi:hypothetical protein